MSIGLLVLRLVFGLLFIGHGSQKLFGFFGGHGPCGTAGFLAGLGFRPALPMAIFVGLSEAGGGLLFALGLAQPLAALLIIGAMVTAIISVHWTHGIWNPAGIEYPLVCVAIAFELASTGAGRWSLDNVLSISWAGMDWALMALIAAVAGSLAILASRRVPTASGE